MLVVTAVHTFVAEHGDELEFSAGEPIEVIERDDDFGDGWWRGRNIKGEEGLFPATYITESKSEDPVEAAPAPLQSTPRPASLHQPERSPEIAPDQVIPESERYSPTGSPTRAVAPIPTLPPAVIPAVIPKPESEDEQELGIGSDTRARLAAQAQLANEARDSNRVSGGVAGLVYSDESEDEEEEKRRSRQLQPSSMPFTPQSRSSIGSGTPPAGSASGWSVEEVVQWAKAKGFEEWPKFQEHEISGDLLLELDANLLKELDIPQFGKRLRIAQAISELRRPASVSSAIHSPQTRGMSAPPMAIPSSPPLSTTPPLSADASTHSRKVSNTSIPPMHPIKEAAIVSPIHETATPVTPTSAASTASTKRESFGSMGHRKGKLSMDNKERLSFFGRSRKPAPTTPSDTRSGTRSITPQVHQMQPATPQEISNDGSAAALKQIGVPDHSGYMKKKGDRYGWKSRYFVLKGPHLYYLASENEDRVKGHIALQGHRVIVDENTNPGSYGFRLVGPTKTHFFSSAEQSAIRGWMKALMKATIARDYSVAVTSSCNIPTIPLAEAQALSPRPPSPASRDAAQRANRRENTNTLTPHDANILMSLNSIPNRPSKDMRRPSHNGEDLLVWVNSVLPSQYPRVTSIPQSFVSGEVIFLLVRSISGLEPSPPVPPAAFNPETDGQPGIEGLFAMMDMLVDAGVDPVGVTLNEVRSGDAAAIARLLESIKSWQE